MCTKHQLPLVQTGRFRAEPSPFAERGEKVAAGRMKGAVTCADAANPSPPPSPLAPQRERETSFVALLPLQFN